MNDMKNTFTHKNLITLLLVVIITIISVYMAGCSDSEQIPTVPATTSVATVDETVANTEGTIPTESQQSTTNAESSTVSTEPTKSDTQKPDGTVSEKPNNNETSNKPENTVVSEGDVRPQHTHSYGSSIKKATCTDDGYTVYSCACGVEYTSDYVDALGHKWNGWVTIKEATSESEGKRENACGRCGKIKSESIDKILGPFDYPAVENPDLVSERVIYYINSYRGDNTYSPFAMEQYVNLRAEQIINNYSHDANDMQLAKDISGARVNGECLGHIVNIDYTVDEAAFEIVEQFRLGSPLYGSTHWNIITNPSVKCLSVGVYISEMNIYTCVATSYIDQ